MSKLVSLDTRVGTDVSNVSSFDDLMDRSGFNFDIEIALTGESYVSGEETALMEAVEGKRAMPRFRPPFPAQVGLFGKPTNINKSK